MKSKRFSMRFLFLVVTGVAVAVWAAQFGFMGFLSVAAFSGAIIGCTFSYSRFPNNERTVTVLGGCCGAFCSVSFTFVAIALFLYNLPDAPPTFHFDKHMVTMICIAYCVPSGLLGMIVGWIYWSITKWKEIRSTP